MSSLVSKPTGNGWNYYPVNAADLEEAILASADFQGISEVSRFASSAVKIMAAQQRQIDELQAQVRQLLRVAHMHAPDASNS